MRSVALLAIVLFLLPAAGAQGQADPTVTLTTGDNEVVVSREEATTFTLTIAYASQNPLDELQGRTVVLNTPTLPEGWVVNYEPGTSFQMSNEDTQTVRGTVVLSASAEESQIPLTFTATAQSRGGAGLPGDGAVDSNQIQINLVREDPLTREVLEGIGSWIFLVLGGLAILAVVLAVVLARNNRAVVALHSGVTTARVAPGRSVAVPVTVENLTANEDTVLFHVSHVRDGWAASLPVPDLPLDGRQREELHLVITAPKTAVPGDSTKIGLTAHGAQNPRRVAELVVDMHVGDTNERTAAGDTTFADQQSTA